MGVCCEIEVRSKWPAVTCEWAVIEYVENTPVNEWCDVSLCCDCDVYAM